MAPNASEVEFLAIGDGARLWLTEAAAAGTTKIRVKMAQAVSLAKLFATKDVDGWTWPAPIRWQSAPGQCLLAIDTADSSERRNSEGEWRFAVEQALEQGRRRRPGGGATDKRLFAVECGVIGVARRRRAAF